MTGRSVPPPLAIRGPLVDGRGHPSPEFARWCDAMYRAIGGAASTVTQEIITRTNESPVSVFQPVDFPQPVAIHAGPEFSISPTPVFVSLNDPQPIAVDTVSVEIIPIPLI